MHEWKRQRRQSELASLLLQKEEMLKALQDGSRVTVGDVDVDKEVRANKRDIKQRSSESIWEYLSGLDWHCVFLSVQGVSAAVRTAVKATEGQIVDSLTEEASLLNEIQQLKLQQEALATGRLQSPAPSNTDQHGSRLDTPEKAKTKTGRRESGNAV